MDRFGKKYVVRVFDKALKGVMYLEFAFADEVEQLKNQLRDTHEINVYVSRE